MRYGKCSKIQTIFFFCSQIKCRLSGLEVTYAWLNSKQGKPWSDCFFRSSLIRACTVCLWLFGRQIVIKILEHLSYILLGSKLEMFNKETIWEYLQSYNMSEVMLDWIHNSFHGNESKPTKWPVSHLGIIPPEFVDHLEFCPPYTKWKVRKAFAR